MIALRQYLPAVICLMCVLRLGLLAAAPDVVAAFQTGNRLFEEGKFDEAAAAYENIAKSGEVSAELLFNLGTAYLKNDQNGKAIASLIAAENLAPRDENIQRNLQFARTKSGSAEMSVALWRRSIRVLTLNEWTLLAMVPFWVLLILAAFGQLRPGRRESLQRWLMLSAGLTAVGVLMVLLAAADRLGSRMGVVAGKQVVARYGPVAESQEAFALMDGTETTILDETDGWLNVRDVSGRQGWVRAGQIAEPPVH